MIYVSANIMGFLPSLAETMSALLVCPWGLVSILSFPSDINKKLAATTVGF